MMDQKWKQAVVFTVIIFFLIWLFGFSQNSQNNSLQTTFNQYSDIFNSDGVQLEHLTQNYNSVSINDFAAKTEAAKEFGLKGEQIIAHCNDFKSFVLQNQNALQTGGINTPDLLAKIEDRKAAVSNISTQMKDQLEQAANADEAKMNLALNVIKLLIGLG